MTMDKYHFTPTVPFVATSQLRQWMRQATAGKMLWLTKVNSDRMTIFRGCKWNSTDSKIINTFIYRANLVYSARTGPKQVRPPRMKYIQTPTDQSVQSHTVALTKSQPAGFTQIHLLNSITNRTISNSINNNKHCHRTITFTEERFDIRVYVSCI